MRVDPPILEEKSEAEEEEKKHSPTHTNLLDEPGVFCAQRASAQDTVTAQNLLRAQQPTWQRGSSRARSPLPFRGEDARGSRNVVEKPTCIPIAPADERSDRRSPSGTNSHRFNSSPSTLIFEILSHVFDIINIGKTWEQIGQLLTRYGNSQSMAPVTP